jgi:2-[(L-alanin-3-ylcarbamoyl)methyl]-3-(2-aminoethylcarbamoyl)-2-hydroxypropanoate synthase
MTASANEAIHDLEPGAAWVAALQSPHYREVERRVIRQLVQTLIYEDLLPPGAGLDGGRAGREHQTGAARVWAWQVPTADGQVARYRCQGRRQSSFGLVKLDPEPVMRAVGEGQPAPARLHDVLGEVCAAIPQAENAAAFADELEQTLLKDLQARTQPDRGRPLAACDHDELERSLMDGHLYHPSYKSRIGFTLDDNRRYGPEFGASLHLEWVAVRKRSGRLGHAPGLDPRAFIRRELGPADHDRFASALARRGRDLDQHILLPVHPWQWRERVSSIFHPELADADSDLMWLGPGQDRYRAQQSIRTLANHSAPGKAYVKLALGITNTSTSRILAAHTVLNGPIVTDWLQSLMARDPFVLDRGFFFLGEVMGATFGYAALPEPRRGRAYGNLGAIWRESLHPHLRPGEAAVPFNGLCHLDQPGRPLIDPWIERHGLRPWVERVLRAAVSPIIHLLFGHGVGIESHAQNILLLHREGLPTRVALKDLHDGVRFSIAHLAEPRRAPALEAVPASHARINRTSFIVTDDPEAVRDFSCDSFFFICLAELAVFLERHYHLPEEEFWTMTAGVIRDYQAGHPQHAARFAAFDVFADTFEVEALTRRRLLGDAEPRVHRVPNPLRAVGGR